MLPKLVVTDLDGTIVRSDGTVSAYTHVVLKRCHEAGVPVVGATGRGPRLTGLSREQLPSATYFVLGGGGRVLDLTGAEPVVLRDARFEASELERLIAALEERFGPLSLTVEVSDGERSPLWSEDPTWPYPDAIEQHDRAELFGARSIIKAFLRVEPDLGDDIVKAAPELPNCGVELIQAWPGFVEITPPHIDKATGCTIITDLLDISPMDVIAFGDQLNDVPLFRWAGRRIAVSNAHPELAALASDITTSNDEDGVAVYLDRLLA